MQARDAGTGSPQRSPSIAPDALRQGRRSAVTPALTAGTTAHDRQPLATTGTLLSTVGLEEHRAVAGSRMKGELSMSSAPPSTIATLVPDATADLLHEVAQVVADPATWLNTPNDALGGESPMNLIGTPQEQRLRDLLRAIQHGMFS